MDSINNIAGIDYQTWKNNINQILIYKHFRAEAEERNRFLAKKMEVYEQIKNKTPKQGQEYMQLVQEVVHNCSQVFRKTKENSNNEQLIKYLQEEKHVDVSEEGYKRWLETGEKIKL